MKALYGLFVLGLLSFAAWSVVPDPIPAPVSIVNFMVCGRVYEVVIVMSDNTVVLGSDLMDDEEAARAMAAKTVKILPNDPHYRAYNFHHPKLCKPI